MKINANNFQVQTWATDSTLVSFNDIHFQTYYKWKPWTECSSCTNIGRKYKYGTCYVASQIGKGLT